MQLSGLEKIAVEVFPDESNDISVKVAGTIADKIRENNSIGNKTVLGLSIGITLLDVYRELARMHREEGLDLSNVVTFNLDELYGIKPDDIHSYDRYIRENFLDLINIKKENIHTLDGKISRGLIKKYSKEYEQKIRDAGGIDIQLLGIGRTGHIGFNEPGSSIDSRTRLIVLDNLTIIDALPDFGEEIYAPKEAITMGVGTIMEAKQIILMARGDHKAPIIREVVEGSINEDSAASYLQGHENVTFYVDQAAGSELARSRTPWVSNDFEWTENAVGRAVCHVSEQTGKPIIQLKRKDFERYSLEGITINENLKGVKQLVIKSLERKISDGDGIYSGKRILVFSPHPDDDIISMGGILMKIAGNENSYVHVAYMTSGYTAVFDSDVVKFIAKGGLNNEDESLQKRVLDLIRRKQSTEFGVVEGINQKRIDELLGIKKQIREIEAGKTCDYMGVKSHSFLNLPFYQTGRAMKLPITDEDVKIVRATIEKYQPNVIFAAGDLTDPNGTHRLCLSVIYQALDQTELNTEVLLYRGAWQEYHPTEADILVPLSQKEVELKKKGILIHESQNPSPQPGHGVGEFWQRAERRNAETARLMRLYGAGKFKAMESFKIYPGNKKTRNLLSYNHFHTL